MEDGKMKKIYYLLLIALFLISIGLVGILAKRAKQADEFFEYQKSQDLKSMSKPIFLL